MTSEHTFEDSIESHLLAHGWLQGGPSSYDRALGLDPSELIAFLQESQPDEWEQLTLRLGGEQGARERVAKYVADQLTARGTIEQSSAAPTDPNLLYTLERTISAGHVLHPDELRAAVDALLAGGSANQKIICHSTMAT